jgi:hypothetical protein
MRIVMSAVILSLLLSLFLSPRAVPQSSEQPTAYEDNDAYEIYSVLLPQEEAYGFAKRTLVVREETESKSDTEKCLTPEAAKEFKDAIADFAQVNRKRWLVQRQFQVEKPYEIVNSDTIDLLFKQSGWNGFYARYPDSGGYILMSAVGFNHDRTLAVAYTGSACGNLCGRWGLHLLKKVNGKWKTIPGVTCMTVS